MSKKREYTDEFRREALRLLETSGKTVAALERELGLSAGLLHHWKKRFQVNEQNGSLELTYAGITTIYSRRWNVEPYHKSLEQNASLSKSPTKTVTTQSNHVFASV